MNTDLIEKFILYYKRMREVQVRLNDNSRRYGSVVERYKDIHKAQSLEGEVDKMANEIENMIKSL